MSSTRAGAAGVVEEHEREEADGLGLVGHELGEGAGEADGVGAQPLAYEVGAARGRVPLVEQQVQHGQHCAGALGQLVRRRHAVRDSRVADLALRPHEPLRHGGLGNQERSRDLGGGEPGQGAQRERDLGLPRQRRVTAGEDQPQPIVDDSALACSSALVTRFWRVGRQHRNLLQLGGARRHAAQTVERTVARASW